MFDFLKLLTESLTALIGHIGDGRQKKKIRRLGGKLLLVYVRLNEMVLLAEHILRGIESYLERHRKDRQGFNSLGITLSTQDLRTQSINLSRLQSALNALSYELTALNSDVRISLHVLLAMKQDALHTLEWDTVNAALDFVVERRRRIEQLLDDPYAFGVGPDITDAKVMRQARR